MSPEPLVRLLARAHALEILDALAASPEPIRFVALQHQLGLAPNTLAERLRELTGIGLLVRTDHGGIPPRVDYTVTPRARELLSVLASLAHGIEMPPTAPAPTATIA